MKTAATKRGGRGLILTLAVKDLRHELILSLCLVLAVTAVLGPILILFGLKFGSIQLLRNRLVEDPRNREIRPLSSSRWQPEWFNEMAADGAVAFIVPMTRQISTSVTACVVNDSAECRGPAADQDLLPTAPGDPLLVENGGVDMGGDSCTLTALAAEKLAAKPGDTLRLTVRRMVNGSAQKATLKLQVKAVLDARAGATGSLFVPLEILEQVERYKDGEAVRERGWKGKQRTAYPLYDGLLVHLPKELSPLEQITLRNRTGFSTVEKINKNQMQARFGFQIGAPGGLYLLSAKRPVLQTNIDTIGHRLRGRGAVLLPVVGPLRGELELASGRRRVTLRPLPYDRKTAENLAITPLPRWAIPPQDGVSLQQSFSLQTAGETGESTTAALHLHLGDNRLTLPLLVYEETGGDNFAIPVQLAGQLRLLKQRPLVYDAEKNSLTLSRRAYAGFRLYTTTIDAVEPLRRRLEEKGIAVSTRADRIRDVRELDRSLSLIFYLIALAAAAGGAATLTASLYGSVERKKREIGVLRLVGIPRLSLLRFPIYQGIVLTLCGFAVALLFFFAVAAVINQLFTEMIRPGESLCTLTSLHLVICAAVMVGIAVFASLGAAVRITRLEPVEALRDE